MAWSASSACQFQSLLHWGPLPINSSSALVEKKLNSDAGTGTGAPNFLRYYAPKKSRNSPGGKSVLRLAECNNKHSSVCSTNPELSRTILLMHSRLISKIRSDQIAKKNFSRIYGKYHRLCSFWWKLSVFSSVCVQLKLLLNSNYHYNSLCSTRSLFVHAIQPYRNFKVTRIFASLPAPGVHSRDINQFRIYCRWNFQINLPYMKYLCCK